MAKENTDQIGWAVNILEGYMEHILSMRYNRTVVIRHTGRCVIVSGSWEFHTTTLTKTAIVLQFST